MGVVWVLTHHWQQHKLTVVTDSTGVGGYTVTIIEGCGLIRGRSTRMGSQVASLLTSLKRPSV